MHRAVLCLLLLVAAMRPLQAQTIRDEIRALFRFGECEGEAICIVRGPGPHGTHYNSDAEISGSRMIEFLSGAIGVSVGNIPVAATSSGTVFTFDAAGMPVAQQGSTGPIFGERAQTMGRGRLLAGVNVTGLSFESIRGVDMSNIGLTLTHVNGDPTDDDRLGNPFFETDVINITASFDARVTAYSFFLTYGVNNTVDVGLAVPLVNFSFSGTSVGTIANPSGLHRFEDDASPYRVTARRSHSATGLGDIAARLKVNLRQSLTSGVAVLADLRLPTGSEEDLLGAGSLSARLLGIVSGRMGRFSPHANAGYVYRGGDASSAVLATVGFDALIAPRVTVAGDLVTQWQTGSNELALPAPATFVDGSVVSRTTIPDERDDLVDGSLGAKIMMPRDFTLVLNAIFPINDGGVRPNLVWTAGVQKNF
jgi:hypothetical protein